MRNDLIPANAGGFFCAKGVCWRTESACKTATGTTCESVSAAWCFTVTADREEIEQCALTREVCDSSSATFPVEARKQYPEMTFNATKCELR